MNWNKNRNQLNLGIQLLRAILSFWVICYHCYRTNNEIIKNIIQKCFHVPTFILISFFFIYKNLDKRNITKIKQRNERLLIPYIIWPIMIWLVNNLLFAFFKSSRYNRYLSFYYLIVQLITGCKYIGRFWFHFNLIFTTNFFFIISLIFKKHFLFIIQFLGLISYGIQYLDYNYHYYFSNYKCSIAHSFGYLPETIPLAAAGLTFGAINIIENLKMNANKMIIFSAIILYYLFRFEIFVDIKGFAYRGVIKIFGSTFLFLFFSLLPINNIKNKKLILLIRQLTSYTLGVYIIHGIVQGYLNKIIYIIKKKTFIGCIIIHIISYFISLIGYNALKKTKLKYLFN